jgi:S1-C subfamily serine protease
MGKKLVAGIAAAVLSLTVSGPQSGCASFQTRTGTAIEARESRMQEDLDDIVSSVYCVRTKTEYMLEGAPEGTPPVVKSGHGTAFAYERRDGYTYLVTNVHVVDDPEKLQEIEITPAPGGFAIALKTYVKVSERTYLVDNAGDENALDDIEVDEVSKNSELDIAVIRTSKAVHVADSYVRDTSISPHLGEEAFVAGYPRGRFSAVTRGMVSHPDFVDEDGEHLDIIDVTSTFGNSGSPYFIRRGDRLYWAGTMGKIMPYRESSATMFTLGTPLRLYADMLDDVPQPSGSKKAGTGGTGGGK